MIIAVVGLPRSGTTLMMRMLYRGGVDVVANQGKASFEDDRWVKFPIDKEDIKVAEGKAIKILHPLLYRPPYGPKYKFIFMVRDPKEMMRSQAKFMTGNPDTPVKQTPRDTKRYLFEAKRVLKGYPGSELLMVNFEDVLCDPIRESWRVAQFLGEIMDIDKMASCVMKREPKCLPYLAEWDFEEER